MDCIEFRRRLLVDPSDGALAAAAKARACPDAPSQLADALALEHRIRRALDVDVPATLVARTLAALDADSAPARRRPNWHGWALAASLLCALALGWSLWQAPRTATERLIQASVEHFTHEPYALTRGETVPPVLVARMIADAGLRTAHSTLAPTFLNRCLLGSRRAIHMVLPAPDGPVTVLFVPDEPRVERMDTHRDMVAVRTLPLASGALVLLAESSRDFDRVESLWVAAAATAGGSGTPESSASHTRRAAVLFAIARP
jgi:hypothetical protein